jgi:hypothetical protein
MKKAFVILTLLFIVPNIGSHYQDELFFTGFASPKVMIILDTSGSMAWNMSSGNIKTWGDGTTDPDYSPSKYYGLHSGISWAPSSRYGDKSRLYICKQALLLAINEFLGSIIWGLGSFRLTTGETKFKTENDLIEYREYLTTSIGENNGYSVSVPEVAGDPKGDGDEAGKSANDQFELWQNFSAASGEKNMSHIKKIIKHLDCHLTGEEDEPQELRASGRTPISACLRGARYYFVKHFENGTGVNDNKKDCRKCFVLLVTDGLPSMGIKTSDYGNTSNPQVSHYYGAGSAGAEIFESQSYWEAESLRNVEFEDGTITIQKDIKTFVLGVAPDDQAKVFNDSVAKVGGTDSSYSAQTPEEIQAALHAIFEAMIDQAFSFSTGDVTSIQEDFITTEYEARMYLASFKPGGTPFWKGHLSAVKIDIGGLSLQDTIPPELLIWNAGDSLRNNINPSSRTIYGIKSDNSMPEFTTGNFSPSDLGVDRVGERDTVVNLVRSGNPDGASTSYLGDIFHSAPLRISSPNYFFHDDAFDAYRDSVSDRTAVVYAGSNTGLIHAFRDLDGSELFAVVPKNFVPEVKTLRDSHKFYVDADPMAADVWFASRSFDDYKDWDEWGTVLMAPQGEGGCGMTCLDVTYPDDPEYPKHLFSFEDDTMGLTTSVPVMYKIGLLDTTSYDTLERFFAFFGGGECPDGSYNMYDPLSSTPLRGNVIIALDIDSAYAGGLTKGGTYWYIPAASGDGDKMKYPFASAGSMINLNPQEDNFYDLFYIPDLAGQLWKVDVRNPDVSTWTARCIFRPPIPASESEDKPGSTPAQPAFFAPLIERDPTYECLWLYYGTGDRSHVFKPVEGSGDPEVSNRFYAIMDTLVGIEEYPLSEDRLKKVSGGGEPFSFPEDFVDDGLRGWYIIYDDYSGSGRDNEKTVSAAVLLIDTLKFVTFSPVPAETGCSPKAGVATEYLFHFRTGSGRNRSMGPGIPQAPRYSFNLEGGGYEIHQTSDSIWIEAKSGYGVLKRILKWLEK